MNFSIDPKMLSTVDRTLKGILDRKNNIPICGMYLVEPRADGLTVTATSLDIEATLSVSCPGAAPAEAVCLQPFLIETAAGLAAPGVSVEIDDRNATFKAGRSRFSAPILPGVDFPRFSGDSDTAVDMPGKMLATLIDATVDAAPSSDSEGRFYLEGVFLQTIDGRMHAVGTDGKRFQTISVEAPSGLAIDGGVIVPTKAAKEFARLAAQAGDNPVRLEIGRTITVTAGDERIAAKLIDGQYPAWRKVIPAPTDITATVDLAEMIATLDRVMKIQAVNEEKKKAKVRTSSVRLEADGEFLTISSAGESAEAFDAVPAEFNGDWGKRGVSARFLRATLESMRGRDVETITLDARKSSDPIRIENTIDDDFVAIVMPMAI